MKRIASIQDVSCLGRCSQTVALPVVSAMGVECAILPTAVLSTHTSFPDFICHDLTDQLLPVARHWKTQGVRFDALYTGYLASDRQVAVVLELLELLADQDTLLFVDPAMADHGKLYAGFGPEFPALMARVVSRAQITVPNITEASLMTGMAYRETYDEDYIKALLQGVAALGAEKVVLTGVSFEKDTIGFMSYDSATGAYDSYFNRREPQAYHGTGDIFSATAVGGIMRGLSLREAFRLAVDFTLQCIQATRTDPQAAWYGVEFERALPLLTARIRELADG